MEFSIKMYIKRDLKRVVISIIWVLILAVIEAFIPIVMIQFTNTIVYGSIDKVIIWSLILVLNWLMYLLLRYISTVSNTKTTSKINNSIRSDLSKSIYNKTYSEYHKKDIGEYMSLYINNISQIESRGIQVYFDLASKIFGLIFSVAILLYYQWTIILVVIPLSIISFVFPKMFNKKIEKCSQKFSDAQQRFSSNIKDNLSGTDVVRSFGLKDYFYKIMLDDTKKVENSKILFTKSSLKYSIYSSTCSILCQCICNIFISILCVLRIIPVGFIAGGGNIIGNIFNSIGAISQCKISITSAKAFLNALELEQDETDSNLENIKIKDKITLNNVSFGYNDKKILNDLNISFNKNEKYALVGPSGCGKSTTLKLIMGMLDNYEGEILFDEKNIKDLNHKSFYKEMSYISQDVYLFNTTIKNNITLGHDFTNEEINKALEESALAEDMDKFENGLDTEVGENGANLSGGQKQRISIARALIHKRTFLLVDEGTSALDKKNAQIVEKKLLENKNLTLILVSHHLSNEQKELFSKIYDFSSINCIA